MTETRQHYRLICNGQAVAWSAGPDDLALAEINRHALDYRAEGPVSIEKRIDGMWVLFSIDGAGHR